MEDQLWCEGKHWVGINQKGEATTDRQTQVRKTDRQRKSDIYSRDIIIERNREWVGVLSSVNHVRLYQG